MSISEKATTEELWALIDAGVEAVSCTHMGDRDMVRQFSPTLDRWLDDVKAFWAAVRESDKLKVFVGPRRLEPVAGMLKALFVEVPLVNAFSEYDAIREKLTWHAKAGTIFVFSAGFVSKVLIANLLQRTQEISCIDAGSCWDPLVVGPTRTEQLPKWLLEHEYREWMEGGDAK